MRSARLVALMAVLGPGLLAGLSDDDPAGITTYSIMGAEQGYRLLWVLLVSTAALVVFHELAVRMGVATGQGLTGIIRERYGVRIGLAALGVLVVANLGTTCAEFAGIAAGMDLAGVPRAVSVPVAAAGVSLLVLKGGFHRVEHVLLVLSAVFVTYVASGILSGPSWSAAGRGLVVPSMPLDRDGILLVTACVGTTLAPWGLAFLQSYAVDKRLTGRDLPYERVDVVSGAVLTGVIGAMVVVACAATLHRTGTSIEDAGDAARALEPLAGGLASALLGVGLVGSALLAASILPLSTAYSVTEAVGAEGALDDAPRQAPLFYATYAAVVVVAAGLVLIPGAPLVPILYLTQALNAVLLVPILVLSIGIARDRHLMGEHAVSPRWAAVLWVTAGLVAVCIGALGVAAVAG